VAGQVYAQPVIVGRTVIVATEQDRVYGLNAVTGKVRWSDRLGTPWRASASGCADLTPTVGVTSTPVYDPRTKAVYLVAEIVGRATSQPRFQMFGINARTGQIRERVPIGGSPLNDLGLNFDAFDQWQRTGLLLLGGRVYAAFGSHCDNKPYAGFVAGVNISTRAVRLWTDEAGVADDQGGIWQSGGGLMSDGAGSIFFTSGNGVSPAPGKGSSPPGQLAESVVRLAVLPGGRLAARDFFSPRNAQVLDASDGDLGSGGPVGLPFGTRTFRHLLVQAGKDGRVILLDRDHLGGRMQGRGGGNADVSAAGPFAGQWGHPAVFGDATTVTARNSRGSHDYLYYVGNEDYLRVLKFRAGRSGRPRLADVANSTLRFGFSSGSPVVTSAGTDPRSAVVWVVRAADVLGSRGSLDAFAAAPSARCARPCVMRPIWSAPIGTASKFSIPATSAGRVYVGTRDGRVLCFGRRIRAPLGGAAPLTFGPTALGSAASRSITVTAPAAVTVTGVTTGGGPAEPFTVGRPTVTAKGSHRAAPVAFPVTLSAGDSLHAPVTFRPAARGGVTGVLSFRTPGARYGSTDVPLSGDGTRRGLYARPRALSFALSDGQTLSKVPVGTVVSMTAEITNGGAAAETVTSVAGPGGPFTASGLPRPGALIRPGQSIVVRVSYAPRRAGPRSGSLTFAERGGHRVTLRLAGIARAAVSKITASPAAVRLGRVALGTRATAVIAVTNSGNLPATMTVSSPPAWPLRAVYRIPAGLPLSPGNELRIPVTFAPARAGAVVGVYKLTWTDLLGRHAVHIRIAGTGVR
jgi:outer membrane protein assembly factor BamB